MKTVVNAVGREIPVELDGRKLKPFKGPFGTRPEGRRFGCKLGTLLNPGEDCVVPTIGDALKRIELKDGDTVSFHHHFRNGDYVLGMVMREIEKAGLKDMTIAPTSLFPCHDDIMIDLIKKGVITKIEGGSVRDKLGKAISHGLMERPVTIRSHGGRVRAIENGDLHIDAAFIGAPCADTIGNLNGVMGPSACGPLAFSSADSIYSEHTVAITDNLREDVPIIPISITQEHVGTVVVVDKIGDPKGIASGTLRITGDPIKLKIAKYATKVIEHSGIFRDGMNFQTGAGGMSLAVTQFLGEALKKRGVVANFGMGGTTEHLVNILHEGHVKKILTIQAFDIPGIASLWKDINHIEVTAGYYANPHSRGTAVNTLDAVVLGATEVDVNFNVNVNTFSDGVLQFPTGGHADTAAGSKVTIITTPLVRGRIPVICDNVACVSTPGETIDVVVTDYGIAVNPKRQDLLENLKGHNLPLISIERLRDKSYSITGKPRKPEYTDKIVGVVEYRDGTVIDVVRQVMPRK